MEDRSSTFVDLEQALLGGPRKYTKGDVAAMNGVTVERAARLWRAMGFVDVPDEAVVFTDEDVHALGLLMGFVDQGIIDSAAETSLTRSCAQSMARLADWETRLVRDVVAGSEGTVTSEAQLVDVAAQLVPVMERMQSYVWRRHLIAAAGRVMPVAPGDPLSTTTVVGFADIVGFTSFSRTITDAELAEYVERFEDATSEAVSIHGGRIIKTIGDEVLFVADDPREATEIAFELTERSRADESLPDLRVGLAYGEVLTRLGDVYGPVVNVASRLTSLARPNTALVDRGMAEALADASDLRLRRLRKVSVRGYSRLESWRLLRLGE